MDAKITKNAKISSPGTSRSSKKRNPRFTQYETDLLLKLIVSSDTNSMVTNKITPYGRLRGWEDITASFNAAPNVYNREQKALVERAHNVRKGLSKLCSFAKACSSATGGGHLPPVKPPKVPFEITEAVRAYADSINVKLTGLKSFGDSDSTVAVAEDGDRGGDGTIEVEDAPPVTSPLEDSIDTPLEPMVFFPTAAMEHGKRKRQKDNSNTYRNEKMRIIEEENNRPNELHAVEMEIKNKISRFWDLATEKLQATENINLNDILHIKENAK